MRVGVVKKKTVCIKNTITVGERNTKKGKRRTIEITNKQTNKQNKQANITASVLYSIIFMYCTMNAWARARRRIVYINEIRVVQT
jgi:hypothetical protein